MQYTQRGDWKVKNAMDALDARKVSSTPLTPGNDSLASWIDILNRLSGAGKVEKTVHYIHQLMEEEHGDW